MLFSPHRLRMTGMSQCARVGDLILVSGQAAWASVRPDEEVSDGVFPGEFVGEGDPLAQARQIFRNITDVLESAGGKITDIVKLNCYLTSPDSYWAYRQAKVETFPSGNMPAGTGIVTDLLDSRFLMEVEAVAYVRLNEAVSSV